MVLVRTQIYLEEETQELLQWYAAEQHICLAEMIRQNAKKIVSDGGVVEKKIKKQKKSKQGKHPLFQLCGIVSGPTDTSQNVDEIYEDG